MRFDTILMRKCDEMRRMPASGTKITGSSVRKCENSSIEPLSDERLDIDAIEAAHQPLPDEPGWADRCAVDAGAVPCETMRLVAEVRRLRRALSLSEASRGVPTVGGRG